MNNQENRPSNTGDLRSLAEAIVRGEAIPSSETIKAMQPEEIEQLLHELQGHQLELKMQNEELRRTQTELDAARLRYVDLYELAPVGYCTINEKGFFLEANLTAVAFLGVPKKVLLRQPLSNFILPEDQDIYYLRCKQLYETGMSQTCELRMVQQGSSLFWARLQATLSKNESGEPECHVVISNITDSKQTEEALRKSEERFSLAMQTVVDGLYDWNVATNEIYYSPGWKRMLGYRDEELENAFSVWERLIDPADAGQSWIRLHELLEGKRDRLRMEFKMRHKDGHWVGILSRAEAICDESGKPVRVVGTHVDITDRKRSEQRLRESEANLKAFLNASAEALSLIDPIGTVLIANEATAKRLQTPVEALVGRNIYDLLPPEVVHRRRQYIQQVVETGKPVSFVDQRDNVIVESHLYPVLDEVGRVNRVAIFGLDITRRAQAEKSLQENQALLNATQQLARVGGWEWDPIKQTGSWTEETYRIHGFSPDEMHYGSTEQFRRSIKCYDPDDRPVIREAFRRCVEQGQPYDLQLPFTAVDGRRLWIRTMATPVWEQGRIVKVTGNIIDITRHKQMENLLQARVRLSEAAADQSVKTLLQNVLDEAEALTGSCIGFFHFVEKDQREISFQAWSSNTLQSLCKTEGKGHRYSLDAAGVWADCMRERRPVIYNNYAELSHRKGMPEGHVPVQRELTVPIFRGERIVAILGVGNKQGDYDQQDVELLSTLGDMVWDIVLHKREEEALRESEELFRTLTTLAPVGIYLASPEGDCRYVNPCWCKMTGLAPRQALGDGWMQALHPEDRGSVLSSWREMVAAKGRWGQEYRFLSPEGTITWVYGLAAPQLDASGSLSGYIGINTDITDLKKTQEALHQRESYLQSVFRAAPVGIGVLIGRVMQKVNDRLCEMTGYTREELLGQGTRVLYLTEEEYSFVGRELYKECSKQATGSVESRWRRKDGTIIEVLLNATPIDRADLSAGDTCIAMDITDRKQAEEQLQAMAAFPMLNLAPMIRVDEQGTVMMTNPAGTALGIRPGVWLGEILPALASIDYSTCILFGRKLLCEADLDEKRFQFTIQCEPSLRFAHLYGADITDLKRTEENLSATLAEKEVLLREVHHRVKNNLAAIIGLMDMQCRALDDPLSRNTLTELSGRIRSMSLVHEKLYQAESLAHIDFQEYIQTLVSHLRASFESSRISCEVVAHKVEIPLDLAVPCGLIINELITNALKYAFPEGKPGPGNDACLIRVTMSHNNGTYTLSVADNGIGLPPGLDWTQTRTLGMILIRMLGRHQLGGSYELDQRGGTRWTLTFTARKEKI